MTTPPNLRDVCHCCMNCDHFDATITNRDNGTISDMLCEKHGYELKHPAMVCDDHA
jgi:hypothetical protein